MVSTLMSFIECIGLHTVKRAENLFSIADCCKSVSVKDMKKESPRFYRGFSIYGLPKSQFSQASVSSHTCFHG